MSSTLLQYFLQDDVDSFKRLLANVSNAPTGQRSAPGSITPKIGSPSYGSSPSTSSRNHKKVIGTSPGTPHVDRSGYGRSHATPWSRTQVNARDQNGRTLLHQIASSPKPTVIEFANALLELPFVDIYAQDSESGWTALHRALYSGNIAVAQALMQRDLRSATDFSAPSSLHHLTASLIKIKDREGNSPFDVYGATISGRDIKRTDGKPLGDFVGNDSDIEASSPETSVYGGDSPEDGILARAQLKARTNLQGDEVFTFGSNKNMTLGLGDEDDRQFPERISLDRPDHLLQRFFMEREKAREHQEQRSTLFGQAIGHADNQDNLPTLITSKPLSVQDVYMSKLHTAVLTNDPESNLYMSGFGPGGRLGTGDEATRYHFVCIETGGLAGKKVISLALGQDHSIAISEQGEVFTWGSNKYGQLGYNLPRANNKRDTPMQSTPRQVFNPFKREVILGAAASAIHSVVFSSSGLYTFGKNEGQLGLVDSDARSLEVQVTPRRVGVSLFNAPIRMVSAIDRATAVLLETNETWVFTHYGYSKVIFPLDFSSYFIKESFLATRYGNTANRVIKITAGGNTICALSSFGEVYSVHVNGKPDHTSIASSTTNPAKIRNSLSTPERVWSVRKSHMAANDVDVGQDGSIIICTTSGSAWRKEKRAKIKASNSKDYKFVRIAGLSRVTAVRSNAYGAFAAIQKDCDVTKEQVTVSPSSLWNDFFQLLPVKSLAENVETDVKGDLIIRHQVAKMKVAVSSSSDVESEVRRIVERSDMERSGHLIWLRTTVSDTRVPVHEFILAGRSPVMRTALAESRRTHHFSISDFITLGFNDDGNHELVLQGMDFLSLLTLVVFLYTDDVLDVWRDVRHDSVNAYRYRQVRTEVMRIATYLDIRPLERAARVMGEPSRTLHDDMDRALNDPSFFESGDVTIRLKDARVRAHKQVVCQRCPFFDALFHGRSGGRWLDSRRQDEAITIDLQDMESNVFNFVLRHLYADTEEELFDDVRYSSLDDFIDLVLDVMFAANELMIDRLAQVCQKMLGRFVDTRNVCQLLNAVAPCTVTEFKEAALEYMCLNLETLLENRLLDDLEEDLMDELDLICQENQLARYPISRGRNSEEALLEKYPELVTGLEIDRQRRVDSMRLSSRRDQDELFDERIRANVSDKGTPSPYVRKMKAAQSGEPRLSAGSPTLKARQSMNDLMFQMDDESAVSPTPMRRGKTPMASPLIAEDLDDLSQPPALSLSYGQGDSLGDASYLEARVGSIETGAAGISNVSTTPTIQPNPPAATSKGAPWVSADISGDKRNLKDIMAETSTSRVSNLTLGMTDRSNTQSGGTFTQKMSQKERKRLQQIQAQEALAAQQKAAVESRQSPWQTVSKKPTPSSLTGDDSANQFKTVQKPAMTLRQTVAGSPSIRPTSNPGLSPSGQGRGLSQPLLGPSTNAKPIPARTNPVALKTRPSPSLSPLSTPQPIIQSIRHTPRPERSLPGPSGQTSLASILLQQQAEKDEIREAASAKHNLQDIQAEQEFQEWWDKESKRVMEAEAAAAAAAASQTSRNRNGRRKNRGQQSQQHQQRQGGNKPQQREKADMSNEAPRSQGKRPTHHRPPKNPQPPAGPGNSRSESIHSRGNGRGGGGRLEGVIDGVGGMGDVELGTDGGGVGGGGRSGDIELGSGREDGGERSGDLIDGNDPGDMTWMLIVKTAEADLEL
ncbi:BTB domain and ankyrin repeat protein [Talaromyces stipitatus ATCC 10500]|uniref:BTB domain and ankyrin repeat protein n=1 Tax=Talaromyces stipitatus (strain ATCC 10500 / CBS 375.48 / QM 6759 / NRRL 1006) TaxID=441959 RepID=B8LYK8_TALSN|nr:BTB domain and ankyrin repeat protein [Talaromyces stipitatus ATCC 10500]EED23366.1 BTB domain and ankyrin repeat protein [Talaromyces stipitatus ATCC 10500]